MKIIRGRKIVGDISKIIGDVSVNLPTTPPPPPPSLEVKSPPDKIVSENFYRSDQSWHYDLVVITYKGNRFKVAIRRNAYDEQSYLRGYCFNRESTSWQLLVDHPIYGAACEKVSYVHEKAPKEPFVQDAKSVLNELKLIVNGHL